MLESGEVQQFIVFLGEYFYIVGMLAGRMPISVDGEE